MEPDEITLCNTLRMAVRWHTQRSGLNREDSEDCMGEFVLQMLRKRCRSRADDDTSSRGDTGGQTEGSERFSSPAWTHRCAQNFVRDYCRVHSRQKQREFSWSETIAEDGVPQSWECPSTTLAAPEAFLLHRECARCLKDTLNCLQPAQQEYFVRHHLQGESVQSLARTSGHTPHAIEQALFRARRRVRDILTRKGWDEREMRQHFSVSFLT